MGIVPNRSLVVGLDLQNSRFALVASEGFAYVVSSDTSGNNVQVRVIDPACNAP
jgi:hypothetical protein